MASVATYLNHVRPTFIGAVALAALALTPQQHVVPRAATEVGIAAMHERLGGLRLELSFQSPPVIRPAPHPDARPWPQGMVIGMGTPSVDPGILIWDGSPLDNLLSVMLAPFRAFAT
jgi:hypothetical protein